MAMASGHDSDMLMVHDDEPDEPAPQSRLPAWRVLVVDDDPDVHRATSLALAHQQILGRPLQLLHAHSAHEALQVLQSRSDVAVLLLDVVMESVHAGLDLVHQVREELGLDEMRIVLRTGQAGYAPELDTLRNYDINDYKTKSELTRPKLYAALTTAIRSYDQIRTLNASRRALNRMVQAGAHLMTLKGTQAFAEGLLQELAALLEQAPIGIVCATEPQRGGGPSKARVLAVGGGFRAAVGNGIGELPDPRVRTQLETTLMQHQSRLDEQSVTLYVRTSDGNEWLCHLVAEYALPTFYQELLGLFAANVALCFANVRMVGQLGNYAYVDPLLQIPNRLALIQRLDELRERQQQMGQALVLIDIDQFSQYNDGLGHHFGDLLLKATAERIRDGLPAQVFLARISKDSFAVLGPEAQLSPELLQTLFQSPLLVDGGETSIATTQGFVRLTDIPPSPGEEVIRCAGIALKHAKALHRGENSYYTPSMGNDITERLHLHQGLRQALKLNQLFLVFQPQVRMSDGQPVGAEALLRWRTEDGQLVSPSRFIPVAESSGLMVNLGQWVLRQACLELRKLQDRGHTDFRMSVNVSMLQFAHPQFLHNLDQAIADSGIPTHRLELEVTESIASLEMERIAMILGAIRARGVSVAIDDFGTGFSSLSYLERLAIDRLKIDRSFVMRYDPSTDSEPVAAAVVDLGRKLQLKVIAEGVETQEQVNWLQRLGCDEAQGYWYAQPMEAAALGAWLEARGTT